MAKLRDYTSRLGFSVMIPASWGYNENTEKVDLSAKEQERQNKWLEVGKGSAVAEKAAMMFVETLSGLSTAVQCISSMGRARHHSDRQFVLRFSRLCRHAAIHDLLLEESQLLKNVDAVHAAAHSSDACSLLLRF